MSLFSGGDIRLNFVQNITASSSNPSQQKERPHQGLDSKQAHQEQLGLSSTATVARSAEQQHIHTPYTQHTAYRRQQPCCHEPRYWSATDRYRATLLQRKQVQDASLWFPYRVRAGRTAGNSCGHSLVQSPECGNEFNQAWESCTTTG